MKESPYKEKILTWEWNDNFPVGQKVKAVVDGKEIATVTTSTARRANNIAVIDLKGVDGPVWLRRVRAVGKVAHG